MPNGKIDRTLKLKIFLNEELTPCTPYILHDVS